MSAAELRAVAATVLSQVLPLSRGSAPHAGRSLSELLPPRLERTPTDERGLLQELCFGVCRWFIPLDKRAQQLLHTALKPRDADVHALILVGLYQLYHLNIPEHAAIHETVEACRSLGKDWAVKLVNGLLRQAQRQRARQETALPDSLAASTSHPQWLIDALTQAWPEHVRSILAANNQLAPLTLRINTRRTSRQQWLAEAHAAGLTAKSCELAPEGVRLERPMPVTQLPGFTSGDFSVQDEAAQLAAHLLAPRAGERVLDACAAPGGKTTHLLEMADIECIALDIDARRCQRIDENLARLGLHAQVMAVSLEDFAARDDAGLFDAILLDAPCSATGIIRRHPDIKWLRRRADIAALANQQAVLLDRAFALLKPGGRLVYATCSVLPAENDERIAEFLQRQPDARLSSLPGGSDSPASHGWQLFPTPGGHDGFFYARLERAIP